MKCQLAMLRESVVWRANRHAGNLSKHDSELRDGIYSGVGGLGIATLMGTDNGIVHTTDYSSVPDGPWNRGMVEKMVTSVEEYVSPMARSPEDIEISAPVLNPDGAPEPADVVPVARRAKLKKEDFQLCGYTSGCAGCMNLQRGSGTTRNHTEACRVMIETRLEATWEGRERKERAAARREEQLT